MRETVTFFVNNQAAKRKPRIGASPLMANAELAVVSDDGVRPNDTVGQMGGVLHRIQEVRQLQGMSLRTAARQLNTDIQSIRAQEQATTDLKLSDLFKWQRALAVPVSELLEESNLSLSRPVRERAAMVKVMKTAKSLLESATPGPTHRMVENLIEQLVGIMPELAEISSWPAVGQQRSPQELGRIEERQMPNLNVAFAGSGE